MAVSLGRQECVSLVSGWLLLEGLYPKLYFELNCLSLCFHRIEYICLLTGRQRLRQTKRQNTSLHPKRFIEFTSKVTLVSFVSIRLWNSLGIVVTGKFQYKFSDIPVMWQASDALSQMCSPSGMRTYLLSESAVISYYSLQLFIKQVTPSLAHSTFALIIILIGTLLHYTMSCI